MFRFLFKLLIFYGLFRYAFMALAKWDDTNSPRPQRKTNRKKSSSPRPRRKKKN